MSDPTTLRVLDDLGKRLAALEALERPRTNYGSANPTGWPSNVPFLRTDLGWWIYYDGARWLTAFELMVPACANLSTATADGGFGGPDLRGDYAPYVTRVVISAYVATTNNGSNFWTLTLNAYNAAYTTATGIHAVNTSAQAINTWVQQDTSSLSGSGVPTNRARLFLTVTKFGTPGALTCQATLYHRLIVP